MHVFGVRTRIVLALALVLMSIGWVGVTTPATAADPESSVGITKSNDLGDQPLEPGGEFRYQLTVQCSGLTVDCVNLTVTDTLPEGLDVTSLPQSTSTRTVTYDEATRQLTIVFIEPLQEPVGAAGLRAGETVNLEIGMRLPADSQLADGTTISNTATADADNADPKDSTSDVTVSVPLKVTPVATKTWSDGSAIAGTAEESTITLGVRNGSSSSAQVTQLSITDDDEATFENFDLTRVEVTQFPSGADSAQLVVTTPDGTNHTGATISAPGTLSMPAGVAAGDVTGVQVIFTDSSGAVLPYDATGGEVELGMKLRDTHRSDGSPLRPTDKQTVNNCATPAAVEEQKGDVEGADACKGYDILPDTLLLNGTKKFFPDTNGNFGQDTGEYAVLGENSPVSTTIDVKNNSPFPIKTLTITEPDANSATEFEKLDIDKVRVRFPAGATDATLTVTYADGTSTTKQFTENATADVAKAGTQVAKVEVTYTGVDADGEPAITEGSTSGLDLHGTLTDEVTAEDLPDGSSPGIANCAGFEGSAGRVDGTGTASGTACKDLSIQEPRTSGEGVKTVGQTDVPPGQPIPFTLTLANNGNKPLPGAQITDPRIGPDGKPDPNFPNPFDSLQIISASVTKPADVPEVDLEVFDPNTGGGTWVAYDAADTALLTRAKGIRATVDGALTPDKKVTLNLVTERREGVPDGVDILNCFTPSSDLGQGDPACAPQIETAPVDDSASLNKNIAPGTLPEFVPGLPQQFADVTLQVRNDGNLSASMLEVSDNDADFFDAVDFVKIGSVTMPAGANQVQIDAFVDGAWIDGTPAPEGALPAGVDPGDVQGIRARFSSTNTNNDGYVIVPCADGADCQGQLVFQISPRETLRSNGGPVPAHLENTVTGEFLTQAQDPDDPKQIDPNDATLELTEGSPQLSVSKTPDSAIAPGEDAPFLLRVTNSGTANIPNLVVKDALPRGIAFDETFVGDDGQPFTVIDTRVPDGTPPVPSPVFSTTNTGERVSGLAWDFSKDADGNPWVLAPGATLTIEIHVSLEAGVLAGDEISNTMGATSTAPDLTCSADSGSDKDGPFGEGLYCTDDAALTAQAGAAFNARKWVAGNPDLGWYNTRDHAAVPVGDASCASTTDAAGREYTAYPCIALVNPGDRYKYLLRVQNSGTESGTNMRIIDRFPVQGDQGVIVDADRGTEWDKRPTLASRPSLSGPGTLTTRYTTSEPICTDDLAMGGVGSDATQCPESAWNADFGPEVVAAEMELSFDPGLAPGEDVDITFAMDTPLDVTKVSDPTIAWNSYAHAETTDRNGAPHVLPPTEPIQVGVALAYGDLRLEKQIGENPSNLPLDGETFPFRVTCTIEPIGHDPQVVLDETYQVSADQPITVPSLPAGADCEVWETDARGGTSDHDADSPVQVTITPGMEETSVQTAVITNDFPMTVVALDKQVTGDAKQYAPNAFDVDLTCTFNGTPIDGFDPKHIRLHPDRGVFQASVPSGSQCSVLETDSGGASVVIYDPAGATGQDGSGEVTTQTGQAQDITVTNRYDAGGVVVNKETTGAGTPELAQGPFTFSVDCAFNGVDHAVVESITIPEGDGDQTTFTSDPLTGLPAGAVCAVTETDNGGADDTPDPVTVTIEPNQNVTAGFTGDEANQFSAATIGLTKTLTGTAAEAEYATGATFTVQVTCQLETTDQNGDPVRTTVFSAPVDIKGGQSIEALTGADGEVVKLPVGTHCFGEETNTGGATSAVVDHDSFDNAVVATVQDDPAQAQALTIAATNTFEAAPLQITKIVDGRASGFVGDRAFTVQVSCVLDQGGAQPTPILTAQEHQVRAGQTVTIADLPVGAQCWAVETETGGATTVAIDHGSQADAVAVGQGVASSISVVNTFDAGELTVSKKVVNGGPGPYSFELACTTEQGPVKLPTADAAFKLKGGESRTIAVPLGADCTVEEVKVPDEARVGYLNSQGARKGHVAVDGTAAIHVTNTFKKEPAVGGKGTQDDDTNLPDTGAPFSPILLAGALLLVGLGGALTLLSRRRLR